MVVNAQSVIRFLKSCPSPVHDLQDGAFEKAILSGSCKIHQIGYGHELALLAYEVQGDEILIAALKSLTSKTEIDLTEEALKEASKLAQRYNCSYIRFHTFRPGLVRKALDLGFLPTEFILRKKV